VWVAAGFSLRGEKVACKKNMGIRKKRGNRFVSMGCFKTLRGFSHSHEGQKEKKGKNDLTVDKMMSKIRF